MNRRMVAFVFLLISLSFFAPSLQSQEGAAAKQPVAPVRPVTDDYYGTKIVDPYRYMENPKDPEVQAWMKAQNAYTRAVLAEIPGRERLLEQIRKFDRAVPQVAATRLPGDLYLITKLLPSENVSKLYLRQGLTGNDKLIVDPEKIVLASADWGKGKNAITFAVPSLDMKYLAVTVLPGGSEPNTELHVIETATGHETGDVIRDTGLWSGQEPVGGLPAWLPGNRSFVYGRGKDVPGVVPAPYRVYLHVLGTDSKKDPAVFGYGVVPSITLGPGYRANVVVQPNSTYALGMRANGIAINSAFYIEPVADLGKTNSAWRKVADSSDDVSDIAVHGDDLYLLTYKNAMRYKVIRTDARQPNLATAEAVVPESQAVVTSIHAAHDALYVELLDGGINRLLHVPYGPKPRVQDVPLPMKGSIFKVGTDPRLPGALFVMTSWTTAPATYAYDPETNRVSDTKLQPAGPYDSPGNIESVEVKVRSYDGTMVPLSIVYPKSIKLDGSNPTLLSGYGAYGISRGAVFEPTLLLAWYDQGGVYAVCHVRGGGEYGEEWHLAGKGATKPNTWRDFIACSQYLIRHKYTSPTRLAGTGTSAGGILIGRAITSRPDLFAAAIDRVGMSDTLRYDTGADPNIPEFGSVKTEAGFKALYAMSPYAHVQDRTAYPAVLLTTDANDSRVNPWEMDKMAARLQAATTSGKPVLLSVDYAAGHDGMGATEKQFQENLADEDSFLLWQFGVPGFQPPKR